MLVYHVQNGFCEENSESGNECLNEAFVFIKTYSIDPYHLAAMLSLGEIKSFFFARQASAKREFSGRLAAQKQSFLFS